MSAARKRSIAARMAMLFAGLSLLGFSLLSLSLHWVLARELDRHQRDQIQSRMDDMRYMLEHARPPGIGERIKAKVDALTPSDGRNRYWLWSEQPEFRFGQDLDEVLAATQGRQGLVDWQGAQRHLRLMRLDLPASPSRPAVSLMIGMDYHPFELTLRSFETAVLALTLLGTAAMALAGYWVARLGLMPVARMSEEAHRIKPGLAKQRLLLPVLPQELADLGASFNAALERLDVAYQQLQTFNDNVAHELRTPLANLIGQTQVALSREREAPALRELLESNLEELERLRKIVADMLFLARAEQGARATQRVRTALADEVALTLEFLDLLLDEAQISVRVEGQAQAPVEASLFRRALINLLQNALQHSKPGSLIVVSLKEQGDSVEVLVRNPGEAIPAEHLPRLFNRFYRVDPSRGNSGESHGLGLAIVKAVAQMHGGQVFARSADGYTSVGFSVEA